MTSTTLSKRIEDAFQVESPDLEAVSERWDGFEHSVWQDGKWKLEGFITYLQHCHEAMRALDPSLPSSLPSRCFDPEWVATAFGLPVDEFSVQPKTNDSDRRFEDHDDSPIHQVADALSRLADHFAPAPPPVVGTPYVARKLGCTTEWVTQMIRSGEIPNHCVVKGTGKGRLWKLDRKGIDLWMKNR